MVLGVAEGYGFNSLQKLQAQKFSTIFLGLPVSEEQLKEAAEQSGVLNVSGDFLDPAFRLECERLIPNIQDIEAKDCREAYLYLKENCNLSS